MLRIDDAEILNWVHQAQKGEEDAFTKMFDYFMPRIYKRVWHLIPESDVEDVSQDAMMAIMQSVNSFKGNSKFTTWTWVIIKRQVANYYRKGKRLQEEKIVNLDEQLEISIPDPSNMIGDKNMIDDLIITQQAFQKIPHRYQEVIFLRFIEGYQFQEIADLIGKTLEATKSLYRRAVEAIHKELDNSK